MDLNALNSCFIATLDANPDVRINAELQLKQAEKAPGFIGACLDIIMTGPDSPAHAAAAVYVKNKVFKSWDPRENESRLDADEKPPFRERLIQVIVQANPQIRQIMVTILNRIVFLDYPEKWPEFGDIAFRLLNSSDMPAIYGGLVCVLEICKSYRWKVNKKRRPLDGILKTFFPLLLQIGNSLVNETSSVAGEMLRNIFKSYKQVIALELSPVLQQSSSLVPWGTLMLHAISKDPPPESMSGDESDREVHPWWKCKKWAYYNLYRLFSRYGNPTNIRKPLGDEDMDYKPFAKMFSKDFAPEILKVYLAQTNSWVEKKVWLSQASLYNILNFYEEAVKCKTTWVKLKPHTDAMLAHVIFPLLCPSDDDLEIFESEPQEYINKRIDVYDESPTSDIAATALLVTLAEKRRTHTFNGILTFSNQVMTKHRENPTDLACARQQEGAMRMIGSIAHVILGKKSPVAGMMEDFFVNYVFPDFTSQFGFLRARACEIMNRFSDMEFKNPQNISIAYHGLLRCLDDSELPVQVEAVLALHPMIRHDSIKKDLSTKVPQVMDKILALAKKIDLDALSGVMEDFVDVFSEQLTPFAFELAQQLSEQFLSLASELIEQQNINPDDFDQSILGEEKLSSALGILATLTTLFLTLEKSPEVMARIEVVLLPIVRIVLKHDLSEMYVDVLQLVDTCLYCLKRITPNMWQVFMELHDVFKTTAIDFVEELVSCLDYYLLYGIEDMKRNPETIAAMADIVNSAFTDKRLESMDRKSASVLAQNMLLSLYGHMDQYLTLFIQLAMNCLLNEPKDELEDKGYRLSLIEIVLSCIQYNPASSLQILEQNQQTEKFFNIWLSSAVYMKRVNDIKLNVMALLKIIALPDPQIPASVRAGFPQLLDLLLQQLKGLPQAMKKKEELAKEYESGEAFVEDDDEYPSTGDWDDDNEEDDEDEIQGDAAKERSILSQADEARALYEKSEFDNEDEDYLDDEILTESPLDKIDAVVIFRDCLMHLQQTDPGRYQGLVSTFSPAQTEIVNAIFASLGH